MLTYLIAFACILGLAVGQLLFKMSALALERSGSWFSTETLTALFMAGSVYGITSIAWVWVLGRLDLGRAYPMMALAFVLVPIGSRLFFEERFTPGYFVGAALIVAGIVVSVRS
jgi:drug/metabolite transporter (DMT)-like permease